MLIGSDRLSTTHKHPYRKLCRLKNVSTAQSVLRSWNLLTVHPQDKSLKIFSRFQKHYEAGKTGLIETKMKDT